MDYFFLTFYHFIVLVRPQEIEWVPFIYASKILFVFWVLTLFSWLFSAPKHVLSQHTMLLIFLLVAISFSFAFNGWFGGILAYLPGLARAQVIPCIFYATIIRTVFQQKLFMFIAVISALLMVHNGIDQLHNPFGVGWAGTSPVEGSRITYLGIMNDPNDLGMFFVMTIPFAGYIWARSSFVGKSFALFAIGFIIYGIVLTNSRGTLLGLMAVCGLWFLQRYSLAVTIFSSVITVPLMMAVMVLFRDFNPDESSAEGRWESWYEGIYMLRYNPIWGVGYQGYMNYHHLTAHNSYVLAFAELGLAGYFAWFSFLALTIIMLLKVVTYKKPFFKQSDDKYETPFMDHYVSVVKNQEIEDEIMIAKTMLFSMFGFCVTAFFLSRSYTYLLFIYAGMAAASYNRALDSFPGFKPVFYKDNLKLIIIGMFGSIIFIYMFTRVMLHWS